MYLPLRIAIVVPHNSADESNCVSRFNISSSPLEHVYKVSNLKFPYRCPREGLGWRMLVRFHTYVGREEGGIGQDKSQAPLHPLPHYRHLFPNPTHPTNTLTTFVPRHTPSFKRRVRSNKGMSQHKHTAKVSYFWTKRRHCSHHFPPSSHIPMSSSESPLSIPPRNTP